MAVPRQLRYVPKGIEKTIQDFVVDRHLPSHPWSEQYRNSLDARNDFFDMYGFIFDVMGVRNVMVPAGACLVGYNLNTRDELAAFNAAQRAVIGTYAKKIDLVADNNTTAESVTSFVQSFAPMFRETYVLNLASQKKNVH